MSLEPSTEFFLKMLAEKNAPAFSDLPPEQSRDAFSALCHVTAPQNPADVGVEDTSIKLADREIPLRIYTPKGNGPFPVLVYYHGGGFVVGSIADYDPVCRELCERSGFIVVSVEYRLAPEHPFPAAPEDAFQALLWVSENAASFNADTGCLVVGGDSAGGNLAAVVAQRSCRESGPNISAQLLVYPVTSAAEETESLNSNAEGYLLTKADMEYFFGCYVPEGTDLENPNLAPAISSDLSGLPTAWLASCEFDPLRDDGEAYAKAMAEQGVEVVSKRYNGTIHGVWNLFTVIPLGSEMLDDAAAWLKNLTN